MIQQFYFWIYTADNWKQGLDKVYVLFSLEKEGNFDTCCSMDVQ